MNTRLTASESVFHDVAKKVMWAFVVPAFLIGIACGAGLLATIQWFLK